MRKTIVGCRALLGEGALPSRGAVDIVVEGRLIREIRPHGAAEPEGDVVPAQGLLVTAGLINGHHHSHEGFYKGRKDNLPLELWMNYVRPLRPLELTPRDVYLRTMIGAIEAEQKEKDEGWTRNDRLVAVATHAQTYQKARSFGDVRPHLVEEIIGFFVDYNKLRGRKFRPGKTVGPEKAEELIKIGMKKFRRKKQR